MRLTLSLFLAVLLLLPAPAMAADWRHYVNARYGYGVDVPPGFVAQGESENGDGQVFKTPTATLTVFGGNILERRLRERRSASGRIMPSRMAGASPTRCRHRKTRASPASAVRAFFTPA